MTCFIWGSKKSSKLKKQCSLINYNFIMQTKNTPWNEDFWGGKITSLFSSFQIDNMLGVFGF